jgi:hypothetical protein
MKTRNFCFGGNPYISSLLEQVIDRKSIQDPIQDVKNNLQEMQTFDEIIRRSILIK